MMPHITPFSNVSCSQSERGETVIYYPFPAPRLEQEEIDCAKQSSNWSRSKKCKSVWRVLEVQIHFHSPTLLEKYLIRRKSGKLTGHCVFFPPAGDLRHEIYDQLKIMIPRLQHTAYGFLKKLSILYGAPFSL